MLGYTLAQLRAYSRAVVRVRGQRDHALLVLTRAAQADGKDFKKVEKALRDG